MRAFCSETSMPNTGASRPRAMPSTHAIGVDDRDRHARRRPSGRRICARARLAMRKRFADDRAHLGGREQRRRLGAGGGTEALDVGGVHQHEGIEPGVVERVGADARGGLAEGRARDDRGGGIAGTATSAPATPFNVRERRRGSRVRRAGRRRPHRKAQQLAVGGDALGAAVVRRREAEAAGERDQSRRGPTSSSSGFAIETVDAVGDDADAADRRARLDRAAGRRGRRRGRAASAWARRPRPAAEAAR